MATLSHRASRALPLTAAIGSILILSACSDGGSGAPLGDDRYPAKGQYIQVSPDVAEIVSTGETIRLTASVRDALGKQVSNPRVVWETLDPAVATVDWTGTVKGMNEGVAEVRGTFSGVSAIAVVAVSRPKLKNGGSTSVTVYPDADTVSTVGGSKKLLAVGRNPGGKLVGSSKLSWSSTDESVATVDGEGIVTGQESGQTEIIVQNGTAADTSEVWVAPSDVPVRVEASAEVDTIPTVGGTINLSAHVLNGAGDVMPGMDVSWATLDPAIASVKGGAVTGLAKGVARIVPSYQGLADTVTVWVAAVPSATSLYVLPKTDTIAQVGGTTKLSVTLLDGNGQPLATSVTWGTMDAAVATVAADGTVKGVSSGLARITARHNTLVDTAMIWVAPAPPTPNHTVSVDPVTSSTSIGDSVTVQAAVFDADGEQIDAKASWLSLDTGIATISGSGPAHSIHVKGVKAGNARVVAMYGGAVDTAYVTVGGGPGGSGSSGYSTVIQPDPATIANLGGKVRLTWEVYDSTGARIPEVYPTWISLDPSVATVPAGPTRAADVTGISKGTVKIVTTWNGTIDTATVNVQDGGSGGGGGTGVPASVTVTPPSATIFGPGYSTTLIATVRDSAGGTLNLQPTWTSLEPAIATVGSSGIVSAIATGTAHIVAAVGSLADTAVVTVTQSTLPPSGTNLTPTELRGLFGPLVSRGTVVNGWPAKADQGIDAAINRMVSEVAIGSYTYVTDSPDGDNPHYGPLRLVAMRNVRAGLPLNESEPGFAAALKITREFVRLYAKPNNYVLLSHRNTNWADCEIVYLVYRNTPGDNGILANECRDYLHVAANWLSYHMGPQYGGPIKLNATFDERVIALVIETALTADRLGLPYNTSSANPQIAPYKPSGVTSWAGFARWMADNVVKPLQDLTCSTFCGQNDPHGVPIIYGNIRMLMNASQSENNLGSPPYPILFFEDGMLVNALLRAGRQVGCASCRDRAIEMVAGVKQHYDPAQRMLPYVSHDAVSGMRFKGNGQEVVLNNFWVRPLLEMYELTGDNWMRQTALELLDEAARDTGNWTWRFKQAQQLGSATEPQSVQALLAGVHY